MANNSLVLNIGILLILIGIGETMVAISDENNVLKVVAEPTIHVKTIDENSDFVKLHPGVHVEQLTLQSNVNGRLQYVLAARIAGDGLVAHCAQNQSWPTIQNVGVTLTYPASGVGRQVTYVFVQVDQTSNFGQAYVVKGGLHQRIISVVVEAYNTLFLNYDAQFYGV